MKIPIHKTGISVRGKMNGNYGENYSVSIEVEFAEDEKISVLRLLEEIYEDLKNEIRLGYGSDSE